MGCLPWYWEAHNYHKRSNPKVLRVVWSTSIQGYLSHTVQRYSHIEFPHWYSSDFLESISPFDGQERVPFIDNL